MMTSQRYNKDALREAKEKLNQQRAEAVRYMRDVQGMTFQDIGDKLGISKQRAEQIYKGKER